MALLKHKKSDVDELPERPTVYVTPSGKRYVKVADLLRSRRGREAIEELADLKLNPANPHSS